MNKNIITLVGVILIVLVGGVYVFMQSIYVPDVTEEGSSALGFKGMLSSSSFQEKINKENYIILDVRTPQEYQQQHIAQEALLINFYDDDFKEQIAKLDRNMTYLIHCRSGVRSSKTVAIMKELGFSQFYELEGGINAWNKAGLPVLSGTYKSNEQYRGTSDSIIDGSETSGGQSGGIESPPDDGLGVDRDLPAPLPSESDIFCTMDAKVCPDGSSVGRVAPNCEFSACPGGSNNQSGNTINTEPDILPRNTQSAENAVLKITPTIPKENDAFTFFSNDDGKMPVYLSGDTLKVSVSYGGGCVAPDFTLLWDGAFMESYPVQVGFNLVHDGNGDMCDALIYETLEFDLTPLKESYMDGYNTNTGEIVLQIAGSGNDGESILYKF